MVMPKRKTQPAIQKAKSKWIDDDPIVIRIRRAIARMKEKGVSDHAAEGFYYSNTTKPYYLNPKRSETRE
jgi:uncharacterized beta-barrel protein YwiB (DUF1934 family)